MSATLQGRPPRPELAVKHKALEDSKKYVMLTMKVEYGLHRSLKTACAADNVTMTEVWSELVAEWLNRRNKSIP